MPVPAPEAGPQGPRAAYSFFSSFLISAFSLCRKDPKYAIPGMHESLRQQFSFGMTLGYANSGWPWFDDTAR
ncbi:hypothetical protein THSYN_16005 [Candidatus Thiodictyon syntrophicum]|uniref:Uncharacterized protein n=1 Tax=Candidatus Thiodictyon syntrophicum TaxID=1166950 RepID=A0A2K8U9R4_9GAMM|nr:hypothetical protein THSYN_16005 [Candidatus Thiodictyon syntrophicum]